MEYYRLNKIRQKITSQSGASITYALLLFLVCAVVSSVVLAAGTAASGRISQSVSTDQRYYSVTSAARVLINELDGNSNSIVFNDKNNNGNIDLTTEFVSFDGKNPIPSTGLGITDCASVLAIGGLSSHSKPVELVLATDITDSPTVKVKESIDTTTDPGNIKLILDISDNDELFTIRLIFYAGIDDSVRKKKSIVINGGNKTVEITEQVVRKITWNYYDIETVYNV